MMGGHAMSQRDYGTRKVLFRVIEKNDRRIEVLVCHANIAERKKVNAHSTNPGYFIEHHDAYVRSMIRAKYWLARVVSDYRNHFETGRVSFRFR
jgi:hypothetical protein